MEGICDDLIPWNNSLIQLEKLEMDYTWLMLVTILKDKDINFESKTKTLTMKGANRCKGHELNTILQFLVILLLTMVQKVSSSCGEHVCLKWKIQDTNLVLICKVDALNFPITFYDPFNTESGFCVPDEPCHSLLEKAKITKNYSQHEFIFTIPLKIQLNGRWICTYGDNIEKSATEVTLQDIPTTNEGPNCKTVMMLWCLFGFACSIALVSFILFVWVQTSGQQIRIGTKKCCKSEVTTEHREEPVSEQLFAETTEAFPSTPATDNPACTTKITTVVQIVIVFILSVTLFALPVIVGNTEEEHCVAPAAFVVYGAGVGIVNIFLLLKKGK